MEIKIEVESAEKEIKLLNEASSLIGRLQSILFELNNGISNCKSFAQTYNKVRDEQQEKLNQK